MSLQARGPEPERVGDNATVGSSALIVQSLQCPPEVAAHAGRK